MKKLFLALILVLMAVPAFARDVHVNGYTRKDGTYVAPHYRSAADNTVTNNYSYQGNANPYTGNVGHNNYKHDTTSPYYTGPASQGNSGHSNSLYEDDTSDHR